MKWQPIKTCPLNTSVLLCEEGDPLVVMAQRYRDGKRISHSHTGRKWTHWRPIPRAKGVAKGVNEGDPFTITFTRQFVSPPPR